MELPKDGQEYLEKLIAESNNQHQSFDRFSQFLEDKARRKGVPIRGQFELTPLCNFDCKMCYVHLNPGQIQDKKVLTVEQWKDLIYQAWNAGMYKATLTGGECLSYVGFEEIYLYLHGLGCEISVFTNGALLNKRWIHFFREHMPNKIQITLYGDNDDTYEKVTGKRAFEDVLHNIQNANEAGLPIRISITPNRYIGDSIFETIRIANENTNDLAINYSLFKPREETGRSGQDDDIGIEDYLRIRKYLNKMAHIEIKEIDEKELPIPGGPFHECSECGLLCGGGRSGFTIDWKGTMRPCNAFDEIQSFPMDVGFQKAWESINKVAENWPRVPECSGCPYKTVCNTCAANMLHYAEPGKQPLELCEQTKYMVKHGVWHISDCE